MNLPEKLRNLGIQPTPKEKVRVVLSDSQVVALAEVLSSIMDEEESA